MLSQCMYSSLTPVLENILVTTGTVYFLFMSWFFLLSHMHFCFSGCAPPPGSYDPKFESKVKGAVIEKGGRFIESKGSSQSSNSAESPGNLSLTSSSSKSASFNCLPVFRTVSI